MNDTPYLIDHFLIAMPQLNDPNFGQSVTYICEHNSEGAMGITINRLLGITLGEVFSQLNIQNSSHKSNKEQIDLQPVYMGGPVQTSTGFILHTPTSDWESTIKITDELSLTTSKDILEAIAFGEGPDKTLVALGYSGWGKGQLETEIMSNSWLSTKADYKILFDTDCKLRWPQAARKIGFDINTLSHDAGHA